jgi:hypothetical protein
LRFCANLRGPQYLGSRTDEPPKTTTWRANEPQTRPPLSASSFSLRHEAPDKDSEYCAHHGKQLVGILPDGKRDSIDRD